MTHIHTLLNLLLHLDQSLAALANVFGPWTYVILFTLIFCETGILFLAFLPGDSLLFAAGAFCAISPETLNIHVLFILLLGASVGGNAVNYLVGKWLGPHLFRYPHSPFLNPRHLQQAHQFCERYGSKAIVLARFIPIMRTFAPFVAGVGYMTYRRLFVYNLLGGLIWMSALLYGSYLFGTLPLIRDHFGTVLLAIIALSVLPAFLGLAARRLPSNR